MCNYKSFLYSFEKEGFFSLSDNNSHATIADRNGVNEDLCVKFELTPQRSNWCFIVDSLPYGTLEHHYTIDVVNDRLKRLFNSDMIINYITNNLSEWIAEGKRDQRFKAIRVFENSEVEKQFSDLTTEISYLDKRIDNLYNYGNKEKETMLKEYIKTLSAFNGIYKKEIAILKKDLKKEYSLVNELRAQKDQKEILAHDLKQNFSFIDYSIPLLEKDNITNQIDAYWANWKL